MHPILFEIGGFKLPAYGALLVVAFLVSLFLLKREAVRASLDPQRVADAAIIGLLAGLVGAKITLILIDLPEYLADPKQLLSTIRSAGVIYGGQIAGAAGVIWHIRRHNMPFWKTLDLMVPFLALGIGLGRVSCLMAGCCYGSPYEGPLALHFPDHPYCEAPAGVGLFPIQIVSMINGVALFFLLLFFLRRRRFDGQIVALFTILYGVARGLIEIYRGDAIRGLWLGGSVSTSQIIAIIAVVFGAWLYYAKRKGQSSCPSPKSSA